MRTILIRSLAIPAFALLAFAGNTAAQDKSPALLNTLEVQQLVKRGEPADNARLAAHFTALADRYAAEAARHTTMSLSYSSNANRSLGTGMSAHCKSLADLNTKSSTELRELATYHQKLAAGVNATPPSAGARYAGGAGAKAPTDQELKAMAAKARTPVEHGELIEYFQMLSARYTADAKDQTALANAYRGTKLAQAAVHWDRLAALSRDEAKEADNAIAMHKQLAAAGR